MIIGSKLIFVQNLTSTNTYAGHLLRNNNQPEGTIIQTNFQSAGRGQSGNKWESEDSKNLLISIVLFPTMIDPGRQFIISMAISVGICDFLNRHLPCCSIKWPNDIYVNNDKIAGILIENSIMGDQIGYSIAGIGLNVNQEKFSGNLPNPVSLKCITGTDYDLTSCLSDLASDLDKRYKQVIAGSFDMIRNDYISKLYRLNVLADFRDKNGKYSGTILSVAETGRLQIERKSGKINEYSFKEVEFIP